MRGTINLTAQKIPRRYIIYGMARVKIMLDELNILFMGYVS